VYASIRSWHGEVVSNNLRSTEHNAILLINCIYFIENCNYPNSKYAYQEARRKRKHNNVPCT